MSARPQRILIIRNSALGDVAMALTVIYPVCRQYADAEFYLLTRPFFSKIFINKPDNLHIIRADYKGEYHGVRGLMKLLGRLRSYRFTAVADLHNVLRSWIVDAYMRLSGCRVAMVDKKRAKRVGSSIKQTVTPFIKRYADVFAALGMPVDVDFDSVYVDEPAPPVTVSHPAVGIAPFARYANKTYPADLMQRLITLLDKAGVNVYLFGSRGAEAETLGRWASEGEHVVSVAGRFDITDELSLMRAVDLMVTMDSANHHLASLAGVRCLSIWGSTTPACGFGAYGQRRDDAICAGIDCQPCTVAGSPDCRKGTLQCMRALTPELICSRVLAALAEGRSQ